MTATAPLLDVVDLALRVPGRDLLRQATFAVRAGDVWCVLGANGAGKTLLLHTLAGLRPLDGGAVALAGVPLARWRPADLARERALLPQFSHDAFPLRADEVVVMGRHPYLDRFAWEGDDERRRADDALVAMDLVALAARDVTTLSGGERQRVAIASLLVQDAPLMLLDEPVAHLDLRHQLLVLERIAGLARSGHGVVVSLHDLNLAQRVATHVLLFRGDGRAEAGRVDDVMTDAALTAAFACRVARVEAGGRPVFVVG